MYRHLLLAILALVVQLTITSPVANAQSDINDSIAADLDRDGREVGDARTPHESTSVTHKILLYIPNRIFDLLDIVRARVRVGPGIGVGVRVTKPLQLFVGTYTSVFAGLPGPRQDAEIPIPVGLESHNGADISLLEMSVDGGIGPDYSPAEIGVSAQVLIVGADIGFDPLEIVDFAAGLVFLDLVGDDL